MPRIRHGDEREDADDNPATTGDTPATTDDASATTDDASAAGEPRPDAGPPRPARDPRAAAAPAGRRPEAGRGARGPAVVREGIAGDCGSRQFADTVPGAVVERLLGARTVLAVGHEHPDADTLGATLAVCRLVEAHGGRRRPSAPIRCRRCTTSCPRRARFRTIPTRDGLRPPRRRRTAARSSGSAGVGVRHAEPPRVAAAGRARSSRPQRTARAADWIDPVRPRPARWSTLLAVRLGVSSTDGDGALATELMAGVVMDTATFAHPNATPRTLAVSAALSRPGHRCSDISRRLYRTKPDAQLRLFGRVLDRLQTSDDGRSSTRRSSRPTCGHRHGCRPLGGASSICWRQSETAEVATPVQGAGHGTTRISVRTQPGGVDATVLTGRFGGGGHARAAGATVELPIDEARPVVLVEAARLAAAVDRRSA